MIIGTCGFGSTGSSAVSDYLKEYDSFQVVDYVEFTWVSGVDGLIDLEYHLFHPHNRTMGSIYAIDRYRKMLKRKLHSFECTGLTAKQLEESTNDFLSAIIMTSWKWNAPEDHPFLDRIARRILKRTGFISKWEIHNGRQWQHYPFKDVYFSLMPDNFDVLAKKHVHEILVGMGATFDRPLVLDQPFAGNNPQACFKYFDDPYAIVVDRDPRDNYVFGRTKLLGRSHLMPVEPVEEFIKYYRALRKNQPYLEKNDRILSIKFEDMVYHYDETTNRIRDFLHLPENPNPKSIFDPSISMPNTQVWKRFPQFARDIEVIEQELPEYLFDYTGCPEPDPNGKMFFGRSPKNKR